ncbi:MAG: hypothetical protein K6G01_11155 [Eubacterium sp.]|nr:hypothetical protein [Eubacterium sp.]
MALDREALIRGLSKEMAESKKEQQPKEQKTEEKDESRFQASTATLFGETNKGVAGKVRVTVDKDEYNKIMYGKKKFAVIKDPNSEVGIGTNVGIFEMEGLQPTNRSLLKPISAIERGGDLPEGICVIGWEA